MTSILLAALLLQAPAPYTWAKVTTIPSGAAIRIALEAGKIEGTFNSATDQSISIRLAAEDRTFDRSRIVQIESRQRSRSRGKLLGIGFLAGVGAGLVLQKATCSGNNCMPEAAFAYTVPLELTGLLVGAVIPTTKWETVYRK